MSISKLSSSTPSSLARALVEAWSGGAWHIARTPRLGSLRDILFSAAAVSPRDVWAVGERQDRAGTFATLVEHWNGRRWTVARVPSAGLTGSLLQGVAIAGSQVWAVGQSDDASHRARPLVEHLDHGKWTAQFLNGLGSPFSNVTGVTAVNGTVWMVGSRLDLASGDRILDGISAADGAAWTVGAFDGAVGRVPLIEVHS